MNQMELIRRAVQITFRHKVLWLFGILLALTAGGGGGGSSYTLPSNNGNTPPALPFSQFEGRDMTFWIGFALFCCCALLIFIVISVIVRYVATAALYRMVDATEDSGTAPTWKQGFRLGWSSRTLRMWLLDLVIGLAALGLIVAGLAVAAAPLLLLLIDSTAVKVLSIVAASGIVAMLLLVLISASIVVGVVGEFWRREVVLADRSVGRALASGYRLVRNRLRDVAIFWLLMAVIGLAIGILMFVLLVPVLLLSAAVGLAIGFSVYALSENVLLAVLIGMPPFLLLLVVPMTFAEGLVQVFKSSAWTLAFRDVVARLPPAVGPDDVQVGAPAGGPVQGSGAESQRSAEIVP